MKRLREGLASHTSGLLLMCYAQNAYTKVVYNSTYDPNHLTINWHLIIQSLLNHFITDDSLRNEHYAVTSVKTKDSETEIYFAQCLHDMARSLSNVFSNAEVANYFKLGLPDTTS